MLEAEINDIRDCSPYTDVEFPEAWARVLSHASLPSLLKSLFPETFSPNAPKENLLAFVQSLQQIKTVSEFQHKVIAKAVESILKRTSDGLTITGTENLDRNSKYLFISNHRDIICDPAFLTYALAMREFSTPQICLGDNLLVSSLIVDLVKMNKGITVKRNLPLRELAKWSVVLSQLIRNQIESNSDSVWIAQREGRAKDGNDLTHPGILKMLAMSGNGSFFERVQSLKIVPVAISYEYDPCDIFKAKELMFKNEAGSYEKSADEDLSSMLTGIQGKKGRVHIAIGQEFSKSLNSQEMASAHPKEVISSCVDAIDHQIHNLFRNFPTHYVAFDLIHSAEHHAQHYTQDEKQQFLLRMEDRLKGLGFDPSRTQGVRQQFLEGYANSVKNSKRSTAT
jgi:hypothetical protein